MKDMPSESTPERDPLVYVEMRMDDLLPTMQRLGNKPELTEEERAEYDLVKTDWDKLEARKKDLEERRAAATRAGKAKLTYWQQPESPFQQDVRSMSKSDLLGAARTAIEQTENRFAKRSHAENVTKLIEGEGNTAELACRMVLTTASPEYRQAWLNYMAGRAADYSILERAMTEYRAMTAGTSATGGYLVPLMLDPTMIITGAGSTNPFRQISNVKQVSTLVYNGATAAQITAAWVAENTTVADAAPTLGPIQITAQKGIAYVPASYEAFEDINNLAADVGQLFTDARDNLEATAFATGTGSGEPKGIVTAVTAVTASRVSPTTGGTYGSPDVFKVHGQLPARFRSANTAWVANLAVLDLTRQFGTSTNSYAFLSDLTAGQPTRMFGETVVESSVMSSTITTGQNVLLYGDFSRYYIVDRLGATTEFIPNVFDQGTGRPSGTRAWIMHWRTGADCADPNAFRILKL